MPWIHKVKTVFKKLRPICRNKKKTEEVHLCDETFYDLIDLKLIHFINLSLISV